MRIQLVITILALFSATIGYCQSENQDDTPTKKAILGFSYGISLNNVYDHTQDRIFLNRVSPILLGLSISSIVGESSMIKLDVEYSQKGPQGYNISYITLSPMYHQKFWNKELFVELGPYAGSLYRYKINDTNVLTEELKQFDYGVQMGAGKSFSINNLEMSLSYQAEVGLHQFSYSKHFVQQVKLGIYL